MVIGNPQFGCFNHLALSRTCQSYKRANFSNIVQFEINSFRAVYSHHPVVMVWCRRTKGQKTMDPDISMEIPEEGGIIFFDGDCRFCRWALKKLLARDHAGRLRVCDVRSRRGAEFMLRHGRRPEKTFGYLTGWKMFFDVEAYEALLTGPAHFPLPSLLVSKLPRALVTATYLSVANNRAFFSRLVPTTSDVIIPSGRYVTGGCKNSA